MVKEIKSNGRLELTELGGYAWGSVEGENLLVHTRHHGTVRGSVLPNKASVHVYKTVRDDKRSADSMEIRLDKRVANPPMMYAPWASKLATLSRLTRALNCTMVL